jgi:hypothetical protein
MCREASGLSFKDRIFISETSNSHTDIMKENGIKDDNLEPDFYKWECFPKDWDYSSDVSTWKFVIDQDFIPSWVVKEFEEKRVKEFVEKEWKKYHCCYKEGKFLVGGFGVTFKGGAHSTLTGGRHSNLTGGYRSTITSGYRSTITSGYGSNITGGYGSNITGGNSSNITGGYESNLTGGEYSNITGGEYSNITGGGNSVLAGGVGSILIIRVHGKTYVKKITKKTAGIKFTVNGGRWVKVK